jgi:hypothetical protein
MDRTARDHRSLIVGLILFGATSCMGGDGGGAPATSVPVVTPSSAYGPFPYSDPAQRSTFESFLSCASDHGLQYEGPYTDANGEGIYLRLAPGTEATRGQQEKVNRECPQATVGLFGTPVGHLRIRPFERAANEFARCVRSEGELGYPLPSSRRGDPVHAFWQLPFPWSNDRFVSTVRVCTDPLHGYLFSG